MQEAKSAKYLGNYITSKGGNQKTIEERRKIGWGRVAQILGIIGEVDMGIHRIEAGLILRKAMLTNSLLFCAEAWSDVSDADIRRLAGRYCSAEIPCQRALKNASNFSSSRNGHPETPAHANAKSTFVPPTHSDQG